MAKLIYYVTIEETIKFCDLIVMSAERFWSGVILKKKNHLKTSGQCTMTERL